MELPPALRQAVDAQLHGVGLNELQAASAMLSQRYRAETRDGRLHLREDIAAKAYLAARLPATYAAVHSAFNAMAEVRAGFSPRSQLDVGAGPGTALWAASAVWPQLDKAVMLEASQAIREIGAQMSAFAPVREVEWKAADITTGLKEGKPADLVTLAYVLDELSDAARIKLVDRLWDLTVDTLIIVEPGTPAGWQRILQARSQLLQRGGQLVAPCTHAQNCPVTAPDWCHFSRRVARSKIHRLTKQGDVPWEDEKFSYIAMSRQKADLQGSRILTQPKVGGGKVHVKLCTQQGTLEERLITKREKDLYAQARRTDWGDRLDAGSED